MQTYDKQVFAATPIGADGHLDVPLSNIAVSAFSDQPDLIGGQLFPSVNVGKQSNKYYIIDKAAFLRVPDALRAPKTKARKVEFRVSSESYFADNYALAAENALEDLANVDNAIMLRENSARLVVGNLARAMEDRIANLVTSATNLGSGVALSGGDKWSDYVQSDPIADVTTGHAFIRQNTGLRANTMVIDFDTLAIVRRHPKVLDLFKQVEGGLATDQQLREVFAVKKILVGDAVKENQLEGDAASSMTNIWGNNVVLAHLGPNTGLQSRTLGLRFGWRPAGIPTDMQARRATFSGPGTNNVEITEAGHFQDEKIVASALGYAITGTL